MAPPRGRKDSRRLVGCICGNKITASSRCRLESLTCTWRLMTCIGCLRAGVVMQGKVDEEMLQLPRVLNLPRGCEKQVMM